MTLLSKSDTYDIKTSSFIISESVQIIITFTINKTFRKDSFCIDENNMKENQAYFIEILNSTESSKGKKLGFISQEIGREINTIGSKANDSDIQKLVVEMKDELEKVKEQLLNRL